MTCVNDEMLGFYDEVKKKNCLKLPNTSHTFSDSDVTLRIQSSILRSWPKIQHNPDLILISHAFRHLAITTNANDPAVSVEQALRFAGHGSVAAQRPYIRVDETSEAAMMGALGIVPLKKEDADKKPAAKEDGADGAI